jgi:DNA-binding transcriptional MocR family regulator
MQVVSKKSQDFLYQQVVSFIRQQKETGVLKPGDKLPSLRKLSEQLHISVPTVKQAYIELERQGLICARPQSGYYLKAQTGRTLLPMRAKWSAPKPTKVQCRSLIERTYEAIHVPHTVPLGISNPVNAHSTDKALARLMRGVISKVAGKAVSYGPIHGDPKLRTQLAFRYQEQGVQVAPEEILVTNGAQEALSIALQCVAKAGDVIAIESPTFFGLIELIESLGMKALEVYTCAEQGVCVDELEHTLAEHQVAACIFSTAINNPLGSLMPQSRLKDLVELLERFDIPLIEDDVYSELYFTGDKPRPGQLYSQKGLVLTCSSFSKTAAPGYRVGWLVAGKWQDKARQLKRAHSGSSPSLTQWTINEYIASGDYDRHLAVLRKKLIFNCERMRSVIADSFPENVCISKPQGGSVLWVRLPSAMNCESFFEAAIEAGVSYAPGLIFSPTGKYKNYLRLSFGVDWSERVEQAVRTLGQLISAHQ